MALEIKLIGSGQIGTSGTAHIPGADGVGSGKAQIVKSMRFVNTHTTTAVTLNIVLNSGGNPAEKQVSPKNLTLGPGQMYVDDSETALEATHKLTATTGAAGGPVQYAISGIERDA